MSHIIPVVMCGGAGTRLWPASRHSRPKQFIDLVGAPSLFQQSVLRVASRELYSKPICITNDEYRFVVAEQLREIEVEADIVLEPMRRDSCPAVCAACCLAAARDPDAIILAVPADHSIRSNEMFSEAVRIGASAARGGFIVTFGIVPDRPETGYGYIAPSAKPIGSEGVVHVDRFVEKPDAEKSKQYLSEGYLWNSGNFLGSARVFLDEFTHHTPQLRRMVDQAVRDAKRDLDFLRLDQTAFAAADAISIDYAVMERTERAAVLKCTFDWSDIGSWHAVWAASTQDGAGNAVEGSGKVFGGRNNYVRSDGALTALVGVDDLVVVATTDAVMVAARDKLGDIKQVVQALEAEAPQVVREHMKMFRPWGNYEAIDRGTRYQVKRITVSPGARLSLQKHRHRAEHWVVVRGTARVTIGDICKLLHENESTYVPIGAVHRLENPGTEPLELIEVQVGDYLGEDDIERLDDVYGRSASSTPRA